MCMMCINDQDHYDVVEYEEGLCIFIDWSPNEWSIGPNSDTYVPGVGATRYAVQECEDVEVGAESVYTNGNIFPGDKATWPEPQRSHDLDEYRLPVWLEEIIERDKQRAALDDSKTVLAPEASLVGAAGR